MNFKKYLYNITSLIFCLTLTACGSTNDISNSKHSTNQVSKIQQPEVKAKSFDDKTNNSNVEKPKDKKSDIKNSKTKLPPFNIDGFESYMDYICNIPNFKPYYKIVFAFEMLPGDISSVPREKVKSMYAEMKNTFDYVLICKQPLFYRGNYNGDTSFVKGYEEYKNSDKNQNIKNPINKDSWDWYGNKITTTSLKTIMLGEGIFNRFDDKIIEGRNLEISDFTLKNSSDPISVVLGSEYMDVYKLGDILELELISKIMNFKVVGFYAPETSFFMELGAQDHTSFDYSIVMPYFIPDYEPTGEAETLQHAFLLAEMTSGYIPIEESLEDIKSNPKDIYNKYLNISEEMAERNGLSGLYKFAYWPVGFIC